MKPINRVTALLAALCLLLSLAACGSGQSAAEAARESAAQSAVSEAEAAPEPENAAEEAAEPETEEPESAMPESPEPEISAQEPEAVEPESEEPAEAAAFTTEDASGFVGGIDNATIDPAVYLDYSAGIEAGVYAWILSDDGSYYTLAAVDENGEAETSEEAAINVGANNQEAAFFP